MIPPCCVKIRHLAKHGVDGAPAELGGEEFELVPTGITALGHGAQEAGDVEFARRWRIPVERLSGALRPQVAKLNQGDPRQMVFEGGL
jgi:hypothetical protein